MNTLNYVLITPARNEEEYIENTILSVMAQSVKPKRWVIVSDGSTDATDNIIQKYEKEADFITYLRLDNASQRNFASKIFTFLAGYKKLRHEKFDLIGNLDADITFDKHYYQKIIKQFLEDPNLGIGGGDVYDYYDNQLHKVPCYYESVFGAVQMFRKECYDQIGGLQPIRIGGEDTVAEVMARKHGWKTQTFPEIKVKHHRRTGTEGANVYAARFRQGKKDYLLGYHPLFTTVRCCYRVFETPYVLGGFLRLGGYFSSYFDKNLKPEVPDEFRDFIQQEQVDRLKFWKKAEPKMHHGGTSHAKA